MISEFPLFIFTLLGGAAAGSYVFAAFFPQKEMPGKKNAIFPLVALVLLAVSGLCLLTHLGHPERMFNAFNNLEAGITQEGIFMLAFGGFVLLDGLLQFVKGKSMRWIKVAAAIFGFLLLCAMVNVYLQQLGEVACDTLAVAPFFLVANLSLGCAVFALFMDEPYKNKAFSITSIVTAALTAGSLIAMAIHFTVVGLSAAALIVGCVVGPVSSLVLIIRARKQSISWVALAILLLMVVGVGIARFAFYATL